MTVAAYSYIGGTNDGLQKLDFMKKEKGFHHLLARWFHRTRTASEQSELENFLNELENSIELSEEGEPNRFRRQRRRCNKGIDIRMKKKLGNIPGVLCWVNINDHCYCRICIWNSILRLPIIRWLRRLW